MKVILDDATAPALALMERVLRDGEPIAAEYPLVFEAGFPGRVLALGDDEGVRSACTLIVREFLVDGSSVKGGLIGSVSTDPAFRDQGLATRVLLEAEAALQNEGCAFGLLWAQDPDFYLRRGYFPIGAEEDFVLTRDLIGGLPEPTGVRPMRAGDEAAIHALYERHDARVVRTAEETTALLSCPDMTTLVREHEGELTGYACLGRGQDLPDAVHEWGGGSEDVLMLLRAHFAARFPGAEEGQLYLMAPTAATELVYCLVNLGVTPTRGMLGLGKILDRGAAARFFADRLGSDAEVELVATDVGERLRIAGPEREVLLDDDGALALLFPVSQLRDEVEGFLAQLGLRLPRLPVEPFAWGLDSI